MFTKAWSIHAWLNFDQTTPQSKQTVQVIQYSCPCQHIYPIFWLLSRFQLKDNHVIVGDSYRYPKKLFVTPCVVLCIALWALKRFIYIAGELFMAGKKTPLIAINHMHKQKFDQEKQQHSHSQEWGEGCWTWRLLCWTTTSPNLSISLSLSTNWWWHISMFDSINPLLENSCALRTRFLKCYCLLTPRRLMGGMAFQPGC